MGTFRDTFTDNLSILLGLTTERRKAVQEFTQLVRELALVEEFYGKELERLS
jgi:hypothetical protein